MQVKNAPLVYRVDPYWQKYSGILYTHKVQGEHVEEVNCLLPPILVQVVLPQEKLPLCAFI
jgi:hypothetical protein